MIRIAFAPIRDLASLQLALQNALRLEFFTIPPYLTALYSLSGSSLGVGYARSVIRNIVRDEMLHMNLVCNLLNAIGGTPKLKDAIPSYPQPVPLSLAGGLQVHLKKYSRQLVETVFMEIEKPEIPIDIPVKRNLFARTAAGPQTIGQFYAEIRNEIVRQGPGIFSGKRGRQVTEFFTGANENIAVVGVDSALRAIDIIVEQGEGTPQAPTDLQSDVAHYYRFQELAKGMRLVTTTPPYFDSTQPIAIDDNVDVTQMVDNPQNVVIDPADSGAMALTIECDREYSNIVDILEKGFNGAPDELGFIDDTMRTFGFTIQSLLRQTLTVGQGAGFQAGPRFSYQPSN